MDELKTTVGESIDRVERWVEARGYRGWEPFDGLTSVLRPLTLGTTLGERILQQAVRQSPVNLRPLLGVRPQDSTKGRGYMAWGYLNRLRATGRAEYRGKAASCLEWLDRNKAPNHEKHSWGNHFDYASRQGKLPRLEPIIVWSALIGQACMEAHELLGHPRHLEVATSICEWIMGLPREKTSEGTCISYVAYQQISIHNSNMLGAALLARVGKATGNRGYLDLAREAMLYSCARQLPDGGWWYGEAPTNHWVDNFHTGYDLDSLKCYIDHSGDESFRPRLDLGFRYFCDTFFEESGRPKYYSDRVYPVDIQCAAQAIDTLANFSDLDPSALELARRVAGWTIANMQDPSGFFYYRQLPRFTVRIPMLHWGQATMYKALTLLEPRL